MKRVVLLLFGLVIAVPVVLVAQTKPDFSGTWLLDRQKSNFGHRRPQSITAVIKQTATRIVIEEKWYEDTKTFTYALDGAESSNRDIGPGMTKSRFEGNSIVTEGKREWTKLGKTLTASFKEVRSLSRDGKLMTVEATRVGPDIGVQTWKHVFNKQ